MLVQRSISLKAQSVLSIIQQSLWQAGPPLCEEELERIGENYRWIRDSHVDLLCPLFTTKFLRILEEIAERYERSWMEHNPLLCAILIASRIASLTSHLSVQSHSIELLMKCCNIAFGWIESIEKLLKETKVIDIAKINKIRLNLIEACCCVLLTQFLDTEPLGEFFQKYGQGIKPLH
jgi:hypothetical protein